MFPRSTSRKLEDLGCLVLNLADLTENEDLIFHLALIKTDLEVLRTQANNFRNAALSRCVEKASRISAHKGTLKHFTKTLIIAN
jgi:hypothetical protein